MKVSRVGPAATGNCRVFIDRLSSPGRAIRVQCACVSTITLEQNDHSQEETRFQKLLECVSVSMMRVELTIGVNYGRQGDGSPIIWSEGTLMQIVPPIFFMFQIFKHQIACITMQ